MPSEEFYYTDENGEKQDDWIHAEILENPEAEHATCIYTCARLAVQPGSDRETLLGMYGCTNAEVEAEIQKRGFK